MDASSSLDYSLAVPANLLRRPLAINANNRALPIHAIKYHRGLRFPAAGCVRGEVMRLCSRRTRPMFDPYNIIAETDLAQAVLKRFDDKRQTAANTPRQAAGRVAKLFFWNNSAR